MAACFSCLDDLTPRDTDGLSKGDKRHRAGKTEPGGSTPQHVQPQGFTITRNTTKGWRTGGTKRKDTTDFSLRVAKWTSNSQERTKCSQLERPRS